MSQNSWTCENSIDLYGIKNWGKNFFNVKDSGNLCINPKKNDSKEIDLFELIEDLKERGIRLPLLLRFPDILESRIQSLNDSFTQAIEEYEYKGHYQGAYPIKVNQQSHLVEEILRLGKPYNIGLECGSKPELLISLALMDNPSALIICNGFKDVEYIETALLAQKLRRNCIIVIDRVDEIRLTIEVSKKLNIKPNIGFRCKLNSQGGGRWIESSGARSKFGLTPSEIVRGVAQLEEADLLDRLVLLHFHIGSQIPSIQSIKASVKEGARFYTELKRLAPNLKYIDVGGGLGVDYDGSGKSDSSTNYSDQEYANDVVYHIQEACNEKGIEHPIIITESGRSLVAPSSLLVFDVLGANQISKDITDITVNSKDSPVVKELHYIYKSLQSDNLNEYYNDLIEKRRDTLQLFKYGVLDLKQRAKAEDLYWAIAAKIYELAKNNENLEDIYYALENELSDTYFCNFSIFQSLPDSWALKQIFPVMPIHKLNEKPTHRATLVDLTCDSDGKISQFSDTETGGTQKYLEVHKLVDKEPYYLAAFITGAYQEILGDLHNLFGDTDAVHISVQENGYKVDHVVEGDSVAEVLSYVQYQIPELLEKIRLASEHSIAEGQLTRPDARLLLKHYEQGISGYTYFEQPEGE